MKAINIRFSDEEYKALKQLSQQKEMSINSIVREAVRHYITNLRGIEPLG